MDNILQKARRFARQVKSDVSGLATQNPQSLKKVRERQGGGFFQADIGISGEDGKANQPAHGQYEHNSPAKPL